MNSFHGTLAGAPAADYAAADADSAESAVSLDTLSVSETKEVTIDKNILPTRPINSSLYGFDTSVLETPRSIQQVSPDQLKNDIITNGQDLARYAPGLSRNFANGTASVPYIRGQSPEQYQNGIRMGATVPFTNNSVELADIVGGPAAALFGPGAATSGYVNYITKKPFFDKARSTVTLEFGDLRSGGQSNQDFKQTFDTGGVLIKDELAFRLSVQGREGESFYGTADPRTTDPQNHLQVYAALTWIPSHRLVIDTNVQYNNLDYATTRGFNRVTQDLVDNENYLSGAATPIIRKGDTFFAPTFTGRTETNPTGFSPLYRLVTLNGAIGQTRSVTITNTAVPTLIISQGAAPGAQNTGTIVGYVFEPQNVSVSKIKQNRSYTYGDQQQMRQWVGQNRITYNVSPDLTIRNNFYAEATFSKSAQLYQTTGTITDASYFDNRTEFIEKKEFKFLGAEINVQGNSGLELRHAFSWTTGATLPYTDASDLFDPRTIPSAGIYGISPYAATATQTVNPAYLNSAFGDVVTFRQGAYPVPGYSGFRTYPASTTKGKTDTIGLYTQHEFKIGDNWTWVLGGRASVVSVDVTNPFIPVTGQPSLDDHAAQLVPIANTSIIYRAAPWASTYVTYAYTQALNSADSGALTGGHLAMNQFNSESFFYEAGAKFELVPNQLYASLALYHQQRDLAPQAQTLNGVNVNVVPTIHVQGLEGSLQYQPDPHFAAYANYTWTKANYIRYIVYSNKSPGPNVSVGTATAQGTSAIIFDDANSPTGTFAQSQPANFRESLVPIYSFNVGSSYTFDRGFGAGANLSLTGSWHYFIGSDVVIRPQYNLDLNFFYAPPKARFEVRVTVMNVTNQWGFQPNGAENVNDFISPLPPLGVRAALTFKF